MSQQARVPIAVFASGSGTNLQRLLDLSQADDLAGGYVALVVSDRPGCQALVRARAADVPVFSFTPHDHPDKASYERAILAKMCTAHCAWVVLAGYMRLIGPVLLEAYGGCIVNLHPSLLPAFPGKDAIGQALAAGATTTGVSVHLVDAGLDSGPVLAQRAVPVLPGDTNETLHMRVQLVEHELLADVVRLLVSGALVPPHPAGTSQARTPEPKGGGRR